MKEDSEKIAIGSVIALVIVLIFAYFAGYIIIN